MKIPFYQIWFTDKDSHPLGGEMNEYRCVSFLKKFKGRVNLSIISNYEEFSKENREKIISFCNKNGIKLVSLSSVKSSLDELKENLSDYEEQVKLYNIALKDIEKGNFVAASDKIRLLSPLLNKSIYKDFDIQITDLDKTHNLFDSEYGVMLNCAWAIVKKGDDNFFPRLLTMSNSMFYLDENKTDIAKAYRQEMLKNSKSLDLNRFINCLKYIVVVEAHNMGVLMGANHTPQGDVILQMLRKVKDNQEVCDEVNNAFFNALSKDMLPYLFTNSERFKSKQIKDMKMHIESHIKIITLLEKIANQSKNGKAYIKLEVLNNFFKKKCQSNKISNAVYNQFLLQSTMYSTGPIAMHEVATLWAKDIVAKNSIQSLQGIVRSFLPDTYLDFEDEDDCSWVPSLNSLKDHNAAIKIQNAWKTFQFRKSLSFKEKSVMHNKHEAKKNSSLSSSSIIK